MQQKHVLTHRIIMASFYRVEVETAENLPANFLKIKKEDTALYPVSALVEKYFLKT
jgi:hypothetical protein